MTGPNTSVTDEQLVGYLDNALSDDDMAQVGTALGNDAGLRERLDALRLPDGMLAQAFDLGTMDAPAMPAALRDKITATPVAANANKAPAFVWPLALAASFALGMVAMTVLRPVDDPAMGWVDTVASYQALYVSETLAGDVQDPVVTQAVLTRAKALLDVDLTAALNIDGLTFKRVQVLSIEGEPLIQMAYLDDQGRPFAFCLTARDVADQNDQARMAFDLATSNWVKDGVGFVLVGGQDNVETSQIAAQFQRVI